MAEGSDLLFVVLNSVFAVLVLFTNSIVIIVITRSRQLHLPTLWNIAFLAAWDLAFGLLFIVFIIPSKIAGACVYPDIVGNALSKLLVFIITQNIFNIIIALVDRYISICWPLHYERIMSPKRFLCAVISGLLVNIFRQGLILIISLNPVAYNQVLGYFVSAEQKTGMTVSGGFALATVSIIIGLLIRIRLELRKTRNHSGQRDLSTQFTYTMYLSTFIYIVSYMPSAITILINIIMKTNNYSMLQVGMTCILSNSFWNVFIYGATYRPFREALLKLFCPKVVRERARREFQIQFNRNRIGATAEVEA